MTKAIEENCISKSDPSSPSSQPRPRKLLLKSDEIQKPYELNKCLHKHFLVGQNINENN